MSAEKPTDEQSPEGTDRQSEGSPIGQQAKPAAEAKPAAAKKSAAKKPAAEKAKVEKPATEKPAAKKPATKAVAEDQSAAKKPAARKPAAKKPAAAKAETPDAAKSDKSDAKAEKSADEKADGEQKPAVAPDAGKPVATARREAQSPASSSRRKVVRAQARYVRTSARKARMVCGHLRGKSVDEARAILAFTPRDVARDWSKLLESAVANAENNHELIEDDLFVREAFADEGPTIKRFRPRAQGRATPIRKRTSHLTITLTPKP
jgi:ribosomal protein L22